MNTQLTILRAISSEFIKRKLKTVLLLCGVMAVIVLIGVLYLTTVNIWWWALAVPVMVLIFVGVVAALLIAAIIRALRPHMTPLQTSSIAKFVDTFEQVAEGVQTPVPFIVLLVIKDLLLKRDKLFVDTLIQNSKTLRNDYLQLVQNFTKN